MIEFTNIVKKCFQIGHRRLQHISTPINGRQYANLGFLNGFIGVGVAQRSKTILDHLRRQTLERNY